MKGVALQTSPATYRYPGVMGLFPGPPEKVVLELGPTRNQTRTRIRVLCQEEVISLQSSAQAEGPSTRFLRLGPEDWNLALPEIRPDQNQNSSSLSRGGDQSPILSSG